MITASKMRRKSYTVILTRGTTESATLHGILAKDASDAKDQVLKMAGRYGQNIITWERDDNILSNEPYITSVEYTPRKRINAQKEN